MKPVWAVINQHDRSQVNVALLSDAGRDEITGGYVSHPTDRFLDLSTLDNAAAAERLLEAIQEACDGFGQHPQIGQSRDDLMPGIRVFPVKKNYAVFYRVLADAVEIVRVVHAARDFSRLFEN